MKNLLKLFTVVFCCFAAISMASCISEGEDTSIDEYTQKQYQTNMAGSYNGKITLHKQRNSNSVSLDTIPYASLDAGIYVKSDSTITVSTYGDKTLLNALDSAIIVTESNKTYEPLFDAIKNATEVPTVSMMYYIPGTNYIQGSQLGFLSSISIEGKVNYKDKEQYIYFFFQPASVGAATPSTRALGFSHILYRVYVSETKKTPYELNSMTYLGTDAVRPIGLIFKTSNFK